MKRVELLSLAAAWAGCGLNDAGSSLIAKFSYLQ